MTISHSVLLFGPPSSVHRQEWMSETVIRSR